MTTIYTIGHSNHEAEGFLALLRQHDIELVVDVRSSPYSRYVPQANRETLARTLQAAHITYHFMGDRLGGKPSTALTASEAVLRRPGPEGETVDYDELRTSPAFRQAIADLLALAAEQPTAIMCSEGDHRKCHRHKLLTPALLDPDLGVRVHVLHIQPDGTIVDEDKEPRQLALF
jgi:uncharacterized protein (DUF488 family)